MTKSDALGPHERWIRRREAKVSDVGGEKTLRLSPIYYTSIAEIKGFRFKLEKTFLLPKEIVKRKRHQVPGRQAPIQRPPQRSHSPRSDSLTCPKLDCYLSRARGGTALESHTASLLREPDNHLDVWPALAPGTSLILCRVLGPSEDFRIQRLTNDMLRPLRRALL
jgi:hypothetical protein